MTCIRPATLKDLTALVALENECFDSDKISKKIFRRYLTKTTIKFFIAEYQHNIAGYAILFFRKNSKKARLYSIAIGKKYRQYNIATALCQHFEKVALKQKCHTLVLEVRPDNIAALRFYEKQQYEKFGTYLQFYQDGTAAIRMRKKL